MQITNIAEHEQEDMITSFWMMLRECEAHAIDNNDPMLRYWVEGWYRQWNRVTNDNKKAPWDIN